MRFKVEHLIAAISVGLGILMLVLIQGFPVFRLAATGVPGPSFFPRVLAYGFLIVGVAQFIEARKSERFLNFQISDKQGFLSILIVIVAILLYMQFLESLGFMLITFLFCAVIMLLLRVGLVKSTVISGVLVVVLTLLFSRLFRLPLPTGDIFERFL